VSADPQKNPQAGPGYEVRDANIGALLKFGLGLALVLAVTLVAMRFTFDELDKLTPLGPGPTPFSEENTRQIPNGPLLQAKPHMELGEYCADQRAAVDGYAWVNQAGGVVQIPVDRAMELVAQRGLPSRSADEMAAAGATIPQVGAAGEPAATYEEGPCGYLKSPDVTAALPKE
jgi:hypothetical protein